MPSVEIQIAVAVQVREDRAPGGIKPREPYRYGPVDELALGRQGEPDDDDRGKRDSAAKRSKQGRCFR